jgi:hypothetical protein
MLKFKWRHAATLYYRMKFFYVILRTDCEFEVNILQNIDLKRRPYRVYFQTR